MTLYGLVLDLGGAAGWHSVPALGLVFHPEIPRPVGGGVPGRSEPSLDQARAWDRDPGMPLKLVVLDPEMLDGCREAATAADRRERGMTTNEE